MRAHCVSRSAKVNNRIVLHTHKYLINVRRRVAAPSPVAIIVALRRCENSEKLKMNTKRHQNICDTWHSQGTQKFRVSEDFNRFAGTANYCDRDVRSSTLIRIDFEL